MEKLAKALIVLLGALIMLLSQLRGEEDVLIQLRLYQGVRGGGGEAIKAADLPRVVTAYSLRPIFIGNLVSSSDLKDEEAELKRVFNLASLAMLSKAQWGWEREKPENPFQMVVGDQERAFVLQVSRKKERDSFRVEVLSRGKEKDQSLLDTEMVLPAKKTSVLGYEDSEGRPYFLALQRSADLAYVRSEEYPLPVNLKLARMVTPQVPPGLASVGDVVLLATVDHDGSVINVQAVSRRSSHSDAVIAAVRQWKFAPLPPNSRPAAITVNCFFTGNQIDYVINDKVFTPLPVATPNAKNIEKTIRSWLQRNGKTQTDEKFSFNFKETDLGEVVKFVSHVSGATLQMDERIPARVTCNIDKAEWQSALAFFLDMNGLEISDEGGSLRIFSRIPCIAPVRGYITSVFGERLNPFTQKRELHAGIDIATQLGAPVACTADGRVTVAERREKEGNMVVVDHGNGYTSVYTKLNTIDVKPGDIVKLGQIIATVGSTGISTGPHLHYEVRLNDNPVNPIDFIKDWKRP